MLESSALTLDPMLTLPKMSTCLLFYKNKNICDLAMGEEASYLGVGSVSVRFPGTNDIYVIATVYWILDDNANTLSPGAM